MSRSIKRILYGALYLILFALVALLFIPERDGGAPAALPEGGVLPLEPRAATVMVASDGSAAIFARVRNPNANHLASSFSYAFRVIENGVTVATTPRRTGFVYPRETVTLLEVVRAAPFTGAATAILDLGETSWESATFAVRPSLALLGTAETGTDEIGVWVRGKVENRAAVAASEVRVIAILKDGNGFPLFAAATFVGGIPGGAAEDFFIRFPPDSGLAARTAADLTEVVVEGR